MKLYRVAAPLLAVLAASSCFELTQDVVVRRDGSGSIALEFRQSPRVVELTRQAGETSADLLRTWRDKVEASLLANENLRGYEFTNREEGDAWFTSLRVDVADLTAFGAEDLRNMAGMDRGDAVELTLAFESQGTGSLRFHQAFTYGGDERRDAVAASFFAGFEYIVRLRGGPIASHNGTASADGTEVEWRFDLADFYRGEPGTHEMWAVVAGEKTGGGKDHLLWGVVGALGLAVVGGGSYLAGRTKAA